MLILAILYYLGNNETEEICTGSDETFAICFQFVIGGIFRCAIHKYRGANI